MSKDSILFEIRENLAVIQLNRPDVLNSFNREMALRLQGVLQDCDANDVVRAILITGVGKGFCAGQDLEEAIDEKGPGITNIVKEHYNPIILAIRKIEKPVVAFVNGVAAGAGANIALACDITFASQHASFIQAFSKIGLIPDSGGTYTLPRLIGMQRSTALMMLGDKITAEKAVEMGMIYSLAEVTDALENNEAYACAVKLSQMPTMGLGLTKRALNASLSNSLEDQLDVEEKLQTLAGSTEDYQEGVDAFLNKRAPNFKGQ